MPLTDIAVRSAKASDKPFALTDERGLSILIQPSGGKWWRFRYRFEGKAKMLSLGVYPDVSLKDARDLRESARRLLAQGVDPSQNRKAQKAARVARAENSFEVVGREWFAKHSSGWAPSHAGKILQRLEKDVFPWLGERAIAEVNHPGFSGAPLF